MITSSCKLEKNKVHVFLVTFNSFETNFNLTQVQISNFISKFILQKYFEDEVGKLYILIVLQNKFSKFNLIDYGKLDSSPYFKALAANMK